MSTVFKQNQANQTEAWGLLEANQRAALLHDASRQLAGLTDNSSQAIQLFDHILSQADHLDLRVEMQGATGESNELYFAPRGKSMIVGTEASNLISLFGLLMATLLAGNEVILRHVGYPEVCEEAIKILNESGVYSGVMSVANDSELTTLLHISRLAVVGVVASSAETAQIAEDLASTDGILTQLVAVTNQQACHEMFAPDFIERFVTERVKTVNTTAIGGNASLLELGVD